MYIKRDYNQPFFSGRRRGNLRFILVVCLLIIGVIAFVSLRFNELQLTALDAVGMAPTATPFASDMAAQGMVLFNSGDVEGAVAMLAQAVREQPENIDYLAEYGNLLIENDRFDEALTIADRAIEAAPEDPRGYFISGRALMWSDPATAIQVSIQGLESDPDFAPLYAVQGVAYTNLGRWQEGIRNGQRATELGPNDAFVQRSLSVPLIYTGRWDQAVEALETAILINPNLTAPYFELAQLYRLQQVNQPEMAVAVYNRLLEMNPNDARAYLRLCQTYANVENARFDIAQPFCDQAIAIDPEYGDAYMQRGRMQYLRRNYEGSIESFNQCIDFGSEAIECWYLRGLAHYLLGDCEIAWELLQEARARGLESGEGEGVMNTIEIGLDNITRDCSGFEQRSVPTAVPPTAVPPTPIGGFG